MRNTMPFLLLAALILIAAATLAMPDEPSMPQSGLAGAASHLPIIFKPVPAPPLPPPTRIPMPTPTPGFGPNLLANGSFEDGWTDLPPAPGYLINQEPAAWSLTWLPVGAQVWDPRPPHHDDPLIGIVSGIPEMIHKHENQLPDPEKPGQPGALILEGHYVYKIFHRAGSFASQLSQSVTLPAGRYRLTAPVNLHWHENLDPNDPTWDTYTAESGAWVLAGGVSLGGDWATAREMGNRRWFYHVIEFTLPNTTTVEARIRVKSIYRGPKDFFIDGVWLERIN